MTTKRTWKSILVSSLVVCGVSAFSSAATAEVKMGYVDLQKAIQDTTTGKKAKTDLEADFNKRKKELEKMEADLKKMSEDLEKKAMVLSDDVRGQKQAEFQKEMLKYRDAVSKNQMEIQKRERELTLPIVKKLREVIADIAKKEGYTMILEKAEQSVLWAKDDADLTARIVKEYEKKK